MLKGLLYVVGGNDGWSYLNTVERWDPDLRQWSYVAPMSMARSTAGVAVLNNKYVENIFFDRTRTLLFCHEISDCTRSVVEMVAHV